MANEDVAREKGIAWLRGLVHEYPEFGRAGEDGGAPEPDIKSIDRAIEKLTTDDDSLKSLSRSDALAKVISAPKTYNARLKKAAFGKSLCDQIREHQKKARLY